MRWILGIIFWFFAIVPSLFAGNLPFTDVQTTDPYYSAVKTLFDYGILRDDGSHLFRANDQINRDAFVGLSVSVSCHQCITPSVEDIIRYQTSPFVDLSKTNPYFYCIAYAADKGIVQGYILDQTGKAQCLDQTTFSSQPFCAQNQTSRIEAAGMLLRQAGLWNDSLNSTTYTKSLTISDVTPYWYGYAQKGVQIGILTLKGEQLFPDEAISRGEYAMMAAKILGYNQCTLSDGSDNAFEAAIGVTDSAGKRIQKTIFEKNDPSILIPITSTGNWDYVWHAVNVTTGEEVTIDRDTLPVSLLQPGVWSITLDVIDPTTREVRAQPITTIQVGESDKYTGNIGIKKDGNWVDTSTFRTEDTITFVIKNASTNPNYVYDWKIENDATQAVIKSGTGQSYDPGKLAPGDYTVTVTTTDTTTGKVVSVDIRHIHISDVSQPPTGGIPSVLIEANPLTTYIGGVVSFTGIIHTVDNHPTSYAWDFGDGTTSNTSTYTTHIYDTAGVYTVTLTVTDTVTGNTSQAQVIISVSQSRDSDGDGIFDQDDICPLVYGAKENRGCPKISTNNYGDIIDRLLGGNTGALDGDIDGDGIPDGSDLCPKVIGTDTNSGCPLVSLLADINKSACLENAKNTSGLIIGHAICDQCPCANSIELLAPIRQCDVLFPAILSPRRDLIYSRGAFYQVP